jgi:hypothetical protein
MKYRNKKTNGFDSKKEANRAAELQVLADRAIIANFQIKPRFELIPKQDGERAVHYVADFSYHTLDGKHVVEDTKGFKTKDYIIKRKLMLFRHGIKVAEL